MKKWIQSAINPEHKGELRKKLHAQPGRPIPKKKLEEAAREKGRTGRQARLALTLRGFARGRRSSGRR